MAGALPLLHYSLYPWRHGQSKVHFRRTWPIEESRNDEIPRCY